MQDLWSHETFASTENKEQEIGDFCGVANMCGSERKSRSYPGLGWRGPKKKLSDGVFATIA